MVIVASCLGIYLLTKLEQPYSNQIKIVMSITLSGILISFLTIIGEVFTFSGINDSDRKQQYLGLIKTTVYFLWYVLFYLLMLDRLLGSCFPFWYRSGAAERVTKGALITLWPSMVISWPSICLLTTQPKKFRRILKDFVWLILDSVFILIFFVLYASIFYTRNRSIERSGRRTNRVENKQFFKVTSVILISFLVLEAAPTTVTSVAYATTNTQLPIIYQSYSSILWQLNLLADPIIYIFMHPSVSIRLVRYFHAWFGRVEGSSRMQSTGLEMHVRGKN